MDRLKDKIAVITGGGTGIGEAVCQRFAEEGATVLIFERDIQLGTEVARAISSKKRPARFYHVDVSNEEDVSKAVGAAIQEFGRIDVLVNNAAIGGSKNLTHELALADWEAVFAVNVRGVFLCSKHVLKHMVAARRGAIVNLSSTYALIGNDDIPSYHATKGAVTTMTKTDAICYAPHGIRVNALHPGTTLTPLVRKVGAAYPGGLEAYLTMVRSKHPLCLGEPVDVANCVLFLASDEARFVTGASLVADGGYTAQ
jgi:NAD(P)-dependent dehydrogenase (short-subunit alcohol dehydrogenase family)